MKSAQFKGVFDSSSTLSRLYSRAAYQNRILKILHKHLPFPKQAISACFLSKEVLTIYCPDGTWMTRLRLRTDQILRTLHEEANDEIPHNVNEVIVEIKYPS